MAAQLTPRSACVHGSMFMKSLSHILEVDQKQVNLSVTGVITPYLYLYGPNLSSRSHIQMVP